MQTVDYRYLPLRPGDRVLDLGCGEGRHVISASLQEQVTAIGVDMSLTDLGTARERFADFGGSVDGADRTFGLINGDALCLPFADNAFDTVICSEVLEHIPNYRAALAEIERVLRPSGLLCVSVPRAWPERLCWWLSRDYHQTPGGHLRIFRRQQLENEIANTGFTCFYRHGAHALHAPYWWLQCLFWRSRERNLLVRAWHSLLLWDLFHAPWLTRTLDRLLNPFMGKSVVMYFRKRPAP